MKHVKNKRFNRQSWPIKALAAAVIVSLTGTLVQANSTTGRKPIGDLEIYTAAKPGTATVFMMLDTSGSMDKRSIRDDYGNSWSASCTEREKQVDKIKAVVYKRKKKLTATGAVYKDEDGKEVLIQDKDNVQANIIFTPIGCESNSQIRYSRMVRLQIALIELLADDIYDNNDNLKATGSLSDDYEVGLGNFSPSGSVDLGRVLVPTRALIPEQRVDLINSIPGLQPVSWTPTAHALAESGAYMMGTTTWVSSSYKKYSGMEYSVNAAKKSATPAIGNQTYDSPLSDKECSGNGIYLLTDGEPNRSTNARAKALMNKSLSYSPALSVNSCNGLSGGNSEGAWGCMADYAALLRNPVNNPKSLPIKTATVGFGKDFAGLTGTREIIINGESKAVVDCNSGTANQDTRNLCKLGERKGDNEVKTFGDGGFYYTEESSDIAASIVDFASGLVQIINTAPSGTITIPDDPYRAANQLPYAYLPMLDPDINSGATIWKGNLKKYDLDKGTLFGKGSNQPLYKDVAGNLNENTQDLWQTVNFTVEGSAANNNIAAGGVYAQLRAPNSGLGSVRSLYVEDYSSISNHSPTLRKLSVNSSGKPQGFNLLVDTDTYTQLNKRRLLSFLGFEVVLTNYGDETPVEQLILTKPIRATKVLGGVVHSKPAAISYSSTLDDNGRITDTRDDYVLFGSMDGALHIVDADDGKEEVAIIPKIMFKEQPEALVDDSIKDKAGEPYFGVDAPWLVMTDYDYDLESTVKKVTVDTSTGKGMFAYGGLRMGGEAFYGLDITDKSNPKVLFTFNPEGRNNTTNNINFERLGRIWSKPTAAKVRLNKDDEPIDVLVFGGGYDMKYENDDYAATTEEPARGNAIYMVDAKTGFLIWSTSSSAQPSISGYKKTPNMIHSVVGEITVLDRDNDGLMDHLYAADLGGQVFRADFQNARPAKFGFNAVAKFSNKQITRILNVAPTSDSKLAYRFYERPIVSFYRNEGISDQTIANNGKLFGMVNVISGNRSAPLSVLRNDNSYANRVYGIIDTDITGEDVFKSDFDATVKDLTESKLTNLATALGSVANESKKKGAKAEMIAGTKHGWYYPLTRFDGYNNVRYNKGVGDSVVVNNLLYTTVYNPDKQYGTVASCAAKISGGSERQMYCLPYGICMEDTSVTGTGGYIPAGQGIQELTLGAYNKDSTDIKVLIGTTSITDRIEAAKRAGYGSDGTGSVKNDSNIKDLYPGEDVGKRPTLVGGDGSAAEYLFNERYTLQPKAWYQQKQ
ncbi:PilC/PilY family type IV pilus protein [Psychrobacter sp. DAB_AL62B]|uniref:PilC/PilY family type IV pilus protein n=1 Tax=Psychrobacter sp. DAB_AL62B TaxID=1028420 RepID=UPI0023812C4F|nr:PilC/PilY family type IV pilus protein [Psychrobacter sp. DAB_AL62B]MDE4454488.1 pilus assembly protein PilY [Psychrobacter sp. DAB_AL62B]